MPTSGRRRRAETVANHTSALRNTNPEPRTVGSKALNPVKASALVEAEIGAVVVAEDVEAAELPPPVPEDELPVVVVPAVVDVVVPAVVDVVVAGVVDVVVDAVVEVVVDTVVEVVEPPDTVTVSKGWELPDMREVPLVVPGQHENVTVPTVLVPLVAVL